LSISNIGKEASMTQAKLITMDAGTLLTTPLPPTRFIIGGILPQDMIEDQISLKEYDDPFKG